MGRFIIELPGSQAFQPPRPRPRPQQAQGGGPDLSTVANIIRIGQALAPSPELVGDWISGSGTPAPVGPTPAELAEAAGTQQIVSAEQQAMQAAREQMAQSRATMNDPRDRSDAMTPLQSYEGAVGAVNAAQNPEQLALAQAQYEQNLAQLQASEAPAQPSQIPQVAPRDMGAVPQRQADLMPGAAPVAARPAPTDARGILLAAKAAAATGDAQGFQKALSAVASADVSDMPSTSYWGAIGGDEKQKRRRLLGALMKMQVANRPDNRLGWAKFGLAEKAQGTRAKQAETNVRQVKVAERSATVREQMAFLRADAHEKTIKLKAKLLASKVAKTDEQAQKMAEERIAGYVKARLAQITSGTAHIRAKTKTERNRTGLVAAQKVSEKDKHDFGYYNPKNRKGITVNYGDKLAQQGAQQVKTNAKKQVAKLRGAIAALLRKSRSDGKAPDFKALLQKHMGGEKAKAIIAKFESQKMSVPERLEALEVELREYLYQSKHGEVSPGGE